jgi:3-oxoacyl-[acyl-carrier protein] reductase
MKLRGKCSIVTGGAKGIGRATSIKLAREGANVVVADIDFEGAAKVAEKVESFGCRGKALEVNICKLDDIQKMVDVVLRDFVSIDILINNAGVTGGERQTLFSESQPDTRDLIINTNLKGTLNCSRAVINHMINQRHGKIVSIASSAALVGTPWR